MNGKRFSIFSREARMPPEEQLRREAEVEAAGLERDILQKSLDAIKMNHELQIKQVMIQCAIAQRKHLLEWLSREIPVGMAAERVDEILRGTP